MTTTADTTSDATTTVSQSEYGNSIIYTPTAAAAPYGTTTVQGFTVPNPGPPTGAGVYASSPSSLWTAGESTVFVLPNNPEGGYTEILVQFQWSAVYSVQATDAEDSGSVAVSTGVTNTDTETQEFATSIGVSASADIEGIGASVNESFTKTDSSSVSVATDSSETTTENYTVAAGNTAQLWQLVEILTSTVASVPSGVTSITNVDQLDTETSSLTQNLNVFYGPLTYSATSSS